MNINEYISSGILEQYVSGTTSAQERQEVECMSHIYPEIKAELIAIQDALEAMAMAEAKTPPAHLRKNIFDAIDALENENTSTTQQQPIQEINQNTTSTLTFTKRNNNFKAAASILFLLSSGLAYLLYNSNRKAENFANDLAAVKTEIQKRNSLLDNKNTQLAILSNNAFKPVIMSGIPTKSPQSKATIYWNKSSQEVFVAIDKLPTPTSGKQYQLWAIADGKPVDLGMLDTTNPEINFQKMKSISSASAFAVTLEKEGGVPSPTMGEMYVMGGI
jgi:anti-sigma-K factor RskA